MNIEPPTIEQNCFDRQMREMTQFDLQAVFAIERQAYEFPWTMGLMSDCLKAGYHCYVCELNSDIYAYIIFSCVLDELHLLNICIAPEYQNQGYGALLIAWLKNFARDKQIKTLYLEVRMSNEAARHLYQKMGFNEIGVRPDYYPAQSGKEDAQVYACEIYYDD